MSRSIVNSTQVKKFVRNSTLEAWVDDNHEAEIKHQIIGSYTDWIIRTYSRIRFMIINSAFLEAIEQHLPENAKVLDIGCGFGLFANYFAMHSADRKVFGIDFDEKRIEQARSVAEQNGLDNATFYVGDVNDYEFDHGPFDAVVVLDLLHHLSHEGAYRIIQSVYRQLTPGGIFIVKDINTRPVYKLWFTYLLDKLMYPKYPVHYRDARVWRHHLLKAGFSKVLIYRLNDYLPYPHVLLICQK